MNSFELNKVLGAVLGTCLVLVAMHIASGAIFTPTVPAKPGYEIEVKAEAPAAGARGGACGSADRDPAGQRLAAGRTVKREGLPDLSQSGQRPG